MACFSNNGIFAPVGIVLAWASAVEAAAAAAAGAALISEACAALAPLAGASAGFGVSAVCPKAIPEISKIVRIPRIV
jgi:hypothetical protein